MDIVKKLLDSFSSFFEAQDTREKKIHDSIMKRRAEAYKELSRY